MSALVCAGGVLLCAGVASANVGAAGGPLMNPFMALPVLGIIAAIELIVLRLAGARLKHSIMLVIIANLISYLCGFALGFCFAFQPLASIPGGMEWWWAVPWVLLIGALLLTILIEWPILRFAFVKEKRGRALGVVVFAHVISYAMLAVANIPLTSTSLVTDLRLNNDPSALAVAGDAMLVFVGEDGFLYQARSNDLTVSVPVLVDGERVRGPERQTLRYNFGLHAESDTEGWIGDVPGYMSKSDHHVLKVPVSLDQEPIKYDMRFGTQVDALGSYFVFHEWRDEADRGEWMASVFHYYGASVRNRDGKLLKHYDYEILPFFRARFEVTHILPGDIAICSIEPGYPVAIAWRDGWIMDLREMLGARSDVVVIYGTVGDGWPEESTNSEDAHSPEVKSDQ